MRSSDIFSKKEKEPQWCWPPAISLFWDVWLHSQQRMNSLWKFTRLLNCTWHHFCWYSLCQPVRTSHCKHWHCDLPAAGHGSCWKTQYLISQMYWWPIIWTDVAKFTWASYFSPCTKQPSWTPECCCPSPVLAVLGNLCLDGFNNRFVALAGSHPISPRWATSHSYLPPERSCLELSDSSYNTLRLLGQHLTEQFTATF